jgi:hypothetical protein
MRLQTWLGFDPSKLLLNHGTRRTNYRTGNRSLAKVQLLLLSGQDQQAPEVPKTDPSGSLAKARYQ